ncbi:MAG: sigma-70 family RNA polymerase sigma factor [Ruminococcaceae bacterium]|nr:sigma-70 family RNA polymerase sigma factor [Oscillospiraceae bacterium]
MVDSKLRDSFIESNLPLVHSLCKRFTGRGIEYDDLYQAGCIGLIKAADGFDEDRGLCFSTYAVPVILGEIRRMFRDGGSVKVSRSLKELSLKITRTKSVLELKLSREPTVNELATELGVTPEEITEAQSASQPTVSLTYESDDRTTQIDISVSGPEDLLTNKLLLERAFKHLNNIEQQIIRYRYFEYLTQNETATKLGMSQVQVSRAEKKILLKLRNVIGSVA